MSRPGKVLVSGASIALAAFATACGTERIKVPKSNAALYQGAVLFSQRCSGCHTLSYAATHGSAANVRTRLINNGPNFDTRCERPITRVLYAIENGGFSGAIMPQNVVVGQQAIEVARFVATYAGRQEPKVPGVTPCVQEPLGTLPITTTAAPSTPARATNHPRPAAGRAAAKAAAAKAAAKAHAKSKSAHP